MSAPIPPAALAYATRLGWPMFPWWWSEGGRCGCGDPACKRPGKHPLGVLAPRGRSDATTDPEIIQQWWVRFPRANVAVATGAASGVLVLDVDGPDGEASLVDLERRHGPLPETYVMQWTGGGRGGWQAFFSFPAGRTIKSTAGVLGPALDVRAEGGSAIVPPSRTVERYRWATDRTPLHLPLEPLPAAWLDVLDPPQQPAPKWEPRRHGGINPDRIGRIVEAELSMVATAPEGRRNDQLNRSAHALLRFAADGTLDPALIAEGLTAAARQAGLTHPETLATIRSAAAARGMRHGSI